MYPWNKTKMLKKKESKYKNFWVLKSGNRKILNIIKRLENKGNPLEGEIKSNKEWGKKEIKINYQS